MKMMSRHLQFKPHGDNLLTQSAGFWLISIRVLVLAMASAEALSWGYLGYLFGTDLISRWIGALFTGATIFLVVWMVDLSLVTLDRAWSEHAAAILKVPPESTTRRTLRNGLTLTFRIALLLGSLTITAPYLAQVVFHKDIDQFASAEATQAIDRARQTLLQAYDPKIEALNRDIATKRSEYEAETAGKGLSGKYGEGAAARAKRADAEKLEADRDSLAGEKDALLEEFNRLAGDWRANRDKLASAYNIELPKESILQNRKALEELRKRPENRQTELAIKAFLAFIFGGLLLLKMFEPSSVRLYMSEVLQQEFVRYLAGIFDRHLAPGERSTNRDFKMSPQRFYSFLMETWPRIQIAEDEDRDAARKRERAEEDRREERRQWLFDQEQVKLQEERARESRERARIEARRAEQQKTRDLVDSARERMEAARQQLEQLHRQHAAVQDQLKSVDLLRQQRQTEADKAVSSLDELRATIKMVESDIARFDHDFQAYEKRKTEIDEDSVGDLEVIQKNQKKIRQRRVDASHSLSDLKEALLTEERSAERAERDLLEAIDAYRAARQHADALQGKIQKFELKITDETLKTTSVILEAKEAQEPPVSSAVA